MLELDADEAHAARFWMEHYVIYVGVGLLSVVLAATGLGMNIGMPGWIYALLGPLCWWHGVRRHRTRPAPPAA